MAPERPAFQHRPARHGLIGPFGARQIAGGLVVVIAAIVVLLAVTAPLGNTGQVGPRDPRATPFIIGSPPAVGLRPGDRAPDFTVTSPVARSGSRTCAARSSGSTSGRRGARRARLRRRSCATRTPRTRVAGSRSSASASRRRTRPMSPRTLRATASGTPSRPTSPRTSYTVTGCTPSRPSTSSTRTASSARSSRGRWT